MAIRVQEVGDLGEMLEQLAGGRQGRPSRPIREAQTTELLTRWASYQTEHQFVPGQLIQIKHGLSLWNERIDPKDPMLFARYLDPNDSRDRDYIENLSDKMTCVNHPDCVATRIDDDGSIGITIADSRIFEPYQGKVVRP